VPPLLISVRDSEEANYLPPHEDFRSERMKAIDSSIYRNIQLRGVRHALFFADGFVTDLRH
jgi:hypothetical protein